MTAQNNTATTLVNPELNTTVNVDITDITSSNSNNPTELSKEEILSKPVEEVEKVEKKKIDLSALKPMVTGNSEQVKATSVFRQYKIAQVTVPSVVALYKAFGLEYVMNQGVLYLALMHGTVTNRAAFAHMRNFIEIANALYDISTMETITEQDKLKKYSRKNSNKGITLGEVIEALVEYDSEVVNNNSSDEKATKLA